MRLHRECSFRIEVFGLEVLKRVFPLVGTFGHEWVPERYGQVATSRLDESRLLAIRKVGDVLRFLVVLGVCFH